MAAASAPSPAAKASPPKRAGLYVLYGGVACEALGFVLLARGSMTAAPLLIIGSFLVMGVGILIGWD
jgi:hypothetical protein